MRPNFLKRVAVIAATALVMTGTVSPAQAAEEADFTDEQIIRGLVFGEGDFAEKIETDIPLPEGLDERTVAEYQDVEDAITADILSDRATMTPILQELRSGDPYRVMDGFQQLSVQFEESLADEYPEALEAASNETPQVCGPTFCAAAVVAAIAAVTAIAAVNFNVGGNVNMIYNQNGLWTTNGMWIQGASTRHSEAGFDNLPSSDPQQTVQDYPDLVHTEVASRVAAAL